MRTVTAFVASLFLLADFSVAQDVVPDDQVNPDVAAQVDVWIEQMESSKFTVRRNAARQLERIGAAAIEPLEKLVRDGSLDASEGALEILQKHLSGGIIQLAEKARESIQRIADNLPLSIPHSKSSQGPTFSSPRSCSTRLAEFNAPSHISFCIVSLAPGIFGYVSFSTIFINPLSTWYCRLQCLLYQT